MESIVCKFGGSSVADSGQIRKIEEIIRADPARRFIVVSAPGKRHDGDKKITDLLYLCQELAGQDLDFSEPFRLVRDRYLEIAQELDLSGDIEPHLDRIHEKILEGASRDYVASRGEYLSAILIADYLKGRFVEAADVIRFRDDGRLDAVTYDLTAECVQGDDHSLFVFPGFYGATGEGRVKTFTRGGSDITGAIVARSIGAKVYENWTDVSGILMADPQIVSSPRPMSHVTYREVRELTYMGANVFHEEAIFPVYQEGIPINIRNTNDPGHPGTMIVPSRDTSKHTVVGIAGKKGFSLIQIEKMLMNRERGFGRRVFEILETNGISFEHAPTGIDTMSIVISDDQLHEKGDLVIEEIHTVLNPDRVDIRSGLALIATVGEGMAHQAGVALRLFTALSEENISTRIIDQGSSEINIIVGVDEKDFQGALNAIYRAFE